MITRTEHQAILGAKPGQWTAVGLQAAQEIANHIHRPWGHRGPTEAAVWHRRERIAVRMKTRRDTRAHRRARYE